MENKYTLTEEQKKEINQFWKTFTSYQRTIELLSISANQSREDMWDSLKKFYPQIEKNEEAEWRYDHETGTVEVNSVSKPQY